MHEYALEKFDLRQDDDIRVPLRIRAGGALRARVLDRSIRKPLPGWTVLLESQQDYPDVGRIILDWSDEQGAGVLRGAPPGVYQVAYYGPGQRGPRPSGRSGSSRTPWSARGRSQSWCWRARASPGPGARGRP